jgi:SSS family solute:Na+ symporter
MTETLAALILVVYFGVIAVIGMVTRRSAGKDPEGYFLAERGFGGFVLFFTLAATNFSAFTFLGFAGSAYTHGLGQYGIMALGTGFMALMFYVIGRRVWLLGKKNHYFTAGELVGDRYDNMPLRWLVAGVMIIFTVPYLATQAIGAGYILRMMFPGIGLSAGAALVMTIICLYVLSGGMKASGWTDVVQGAVMIGALVVACGFIAHALGGAVSLTRASYAAQPALFSRPGPHGYFTPQVWLSFFILWVLCDPLFPQMFSRFYTAKSERSLRQAMVIYPVLVSFLFLLPVLIGVWAHGTDLTVTDADNVLLLMVERYTPVPVFLFVLTGALAALMSTADSQLLSLSTMLTCDFVGKRIALSKIVTVALTGFAVLFVMVGYDPQTGIMGTLVATTFPGLVVLFPTVLATLYWHRATALGCAASIVVGESVVVLSLSFDLQVAGFMPAMLALAAASAVLLAVSVLGPHRKEALETNTS